MGAQHRVQFSTSDSFWLRNIRLIIFRIQIKILINLIASPLIFCFFDFGVHIDTD